MRSFVIATETQIMKPLKKMTVKRRGPAQLAFRRLAKKKEWKLSEKLALLKAIRKHGSKHIELLMPYVPFRSALEVSNYLLKQRRVGQFQFYDPPSKRKYKFQRINKKPKRKPPPELPPILQWREIILQKMKTEIMQAEKIKKNKAKYSLGSNAYFSHNNNDFTSNTINYTHLRRTLLLLAAYEKHPTVDGIDFSELYHTLYCYVSGEPAPWLTSKRTHRILWMTFQWFCKIMKHADFSEEINFFSNVDPAAKELYPAGLKTYSKNKPKEVIGSRKCNILCVPERLLTLNTNSVIDTFLSSCIPKDQAVNWFRTWYSKDDMANKDEWEGTSCDIMRQVYGVEPPDLNFPYKIKVVFTSEEGKEVDDEDHYMGWKLIKIPTVVAAQGEYNNDFL